MFLSNLFGSSGGSAGDVNKALQYASRRTGVDLDYLKTTAKRESNLDPDARAKTSSATGLFQFIERTWLGVLKQTGGRHGYGELADKIQPAAGGGYKVTDAKARKEILALREDPKAAALMAGEFAAQNAETLKTALGRPASEGELYAAHFLGAQGAVDLVKLAETSPKTPAAERFPAAAAANRSIFYAKGGRARGADEVYSIVTAGYDATPAVPDNATYLAFASSRADDAAVFHGLFRSDGSGLGPLGKSVSGFWSHFPGKATAYGMTEDPGKAEIETDPASDKVTMRVTRPTAQDVGEGASEPVETAATEVLRYGRWRDDPSLPVR